MLKPVHLIHLLIYAPTSFSDEPGLAPIIGRTRLMKMLFLFEKEIAKEFKKSNLDVIDFGFMAYNYGPYSKKVYEAIDFLETREIIEISYGNSSISESDFDLEQFLNSANEYESTIDVSDEEIRVELFSITEHGKEIMKDESKFFAWNSLTKEQQQILIEFKSTMVNAKLKDILRYVYKKYPRFAEKSLIKHRLFID